MEKVKGKHIGILGLGVSGFETAKFLTAKGAHVFVSELNVSETVKERALELSNMGIDFELGFHNYERLKKSDFIVVSPGISPSNDIYARLVEENNVKLVSEIEVASWFFEGDIVAVTGTNGKSTVTTLIGRMLQHFGYNSVICGNIGNPFIGEVEGLSKQSVASLEVSSFQLMKIREFKPKIGLFLNFDSDHLDWHRNLSEYLNAKLRLFENQDADDYAVLNESEPEIIEQVKKRFKSSILTFNDRSMSLDSNQAAALKVAEIYGLDLVKARSFLKSVRPLEHRLEKLETKDCVTYINDSKSTNPASLKWALQKMRKKVILIAGGRNKGCVFSELNEFIREKVKFLVLIGEATDEMMTAWQDLVPISSENNLTDAVRKARDGASEGDVVLLSPGCASFDMFDNYKHRGKMFKEEVRLICDSGVLNSSK